MTRGVKTGVPNEVYRASAGVSHSELKLLRMRTPYHLRMLREQPPSAKRSSPQMILGTAVHCAVLEPDEFAARYCDDLPESRNSKAYKEFAQQCANAGLIPLSSEDRDRVHGMRESLLKHPRIAEALGTQGASEVSAWWIDEATGVQCKCRPDRASHFEAPHGPTSLLIDLKTTSDASEDAFARSVHTFGYHTQADHYARGYAAASGRDCEGVLFVVVESEFPFACAAYELNALALAEARVLNERALRTYAQCMQSGEWPGYGDTVRVIGLPAWAYSHDQEVYL